MSQSAPFERFIHIPGPNPILVTGGPGTWDEHWIEACDITKEQETYYLYYHGTPAEGSDFTPKGYRLGVASAPHPLGPWTKYPDNPVLDAGPEGSWDDRSVACACILKEHADRYFLLYSGISQAGGGWSIGLATGPSPVGPWEKHPANPIIEGFGYVGNVFRHQGRYWLYTEHPIGETGPDYGPLSLAHAEQLEGPWTPYEGNPVLPAGEWGTWDDGGYSEAEVHLRDGVFHVFYGAARLHPTRILSQESIGYAYSHDGLKFTKFPGNPVAAREHDPGAAAFAEVHSLFEPPLIYLFHTLRYADPERSQLEHLGVQILATQTPFCIPMPLLRLDELAPGAFSSLDECPTLSLECIRECALTVECRAPEGGSNALGIHIRGSHDGINYDTADIATLTMPLRLGELTRQSFAIPCHARFVKASVENCVTGYERTLRDIAVTATLKGN